MRRVATGALCLVLIGAALVIPAAHAADGPTAPPPGAHGSYFAQSVDQHDETRVQVQLSVAGAAAFLVVGIGTAAYLLRRRLGLTTYSPDQASGGHH